MVFRPGHLGSGSSSGRLLPQSSYEFSCLDMAPSLSPTCRLMAWILHRLEMALPQPVIRGKGGEKVGAVWGNRGPGSWWWEGPGSSDKGEMVPGRGWHRRKMGACNRNSAPPSLPVCMAHVHSTHTHTHTLWSL